MSAPAAEYGPRNSWTNPPAPNRSTANHVMGGAAFGLGVRFWQLGIQKRSIFSNPSMHALSMLSFGALGYWVWRWDIRSRELIEEKRQQIAARQGSIQGL